jgi:hypothetical protein
MWRIGSTSATFVVLEDASGARVQGWGWADNGYGVNTLGPVVRFAQSGPQRIRIQTREDGLGIDQVVLSAAKYISTSPGLMKNDTTILPRTQPADGGGTPADTLAPTVEVTAPASGSTLAGTITLSANASDNVGVASVQFLIDGNPLGEADTSSPYSATFDTTTVADGSHVVTAVARDAANNATTSSGVTITVQNATTTPTTIDEIVLHASVNPTLGGGWIPTGDTTAASGARLQNPNANLAKINTAAANPAQYFELTFNAEAGKAYRIWLRSKALNDNYNNDSVFVQFDGSVDANGAPMWRIGSTSATFVVLEDASGARVQGWGWADNGYGVNTLGPVVRFAQSGPQRIRIQTREDGLGIDQVVLSAVQYITASPGLTKNDTTILPR